MCPLCCQKGGSLLHCPSTLTFFMKEGGSFLLHFPWSRLHRTLSGILPCEARTFLICGLSAPADAITCLTCMIHLYGFTILWNRACRIAIPELLCLPKGHSRQQLLLPACRIFHSEDVRRGL